MSKKKDGAAVGHPKGTKNNVRSPEEKEEIILELINGDHSSYFVARKYNLSRGLLYKWLNVYETEGIEGFKSKVGENKRGNPYAALHTKKNLTEVERLRLELAKKEVECERLKKGYSVKGVGRGKEYVIINKKNSK